MERRGPDDAWDESWDGNDEDVASSYPPAPLPAHERPWRHPSEVGQAQWQHTEPPIAIGRGLLITTGAIGCVLGIAVLMLLVPLGGGLAPTAAPTVTSSFAITDDGIGSATTTARSELQSGSSSSVLLLPAEQVPSTVLVGPAATLSTDQAPAPTMAIAVSIADQPFMVTTAHAVIAAGGISIIGPGESATGTVVSVGGDLAFIEPGRAIEVASFSAIATAEPGQEVTVLSDEPTEVAYAPDGGVPGLDPSAVLEGTPVVDADGALVALCTLVVDGDGAYVDMVPIALPGDGAVVDTSTTDDTAPASSIPPVPTTTTTTPAAPTSPPSSAVTALVAWAGLRFDGAPASAPLTVTGVAPGSPASAAGITAGDRITSVAGSPVGTVDDLLVEIRRHAPREVITLTVVPRSATSTATGTASITVSVTLGAVPTG